MAKCCFAKWFIALSYIEIHRFTVETVVTIPFVVLVSITIRSTWVISSPEFFFWNHKLFNVNFKRDCQIMVSRSCGNLWFVTSYFLCLKKGGSNPRNPVSPTSELWTGHTSTTTRTSCQYSSPTSLPRVSLRTTFYYYAENPVRAHMITW